MRGVRVSLDERPRRALGQYFTPEAVARFAVGLLARFGAFADASPTVIDPAAGPGLFLEAVKSAAPGARAVGLDIDAALAAGDVALGNGLVDHPALGVAEGAFDVVVGNPPYGGLGLVQLLQLSRGEASREAWTLADAVLAGSEALRASLEGDALPDLAARHVTPRLARWLDRAFRHPVENLFIERFVKLLRPGGWMAVVVPEGVLANARAERLRAWMADRGAVAAVVGLPRLFAQAGASARTAVLVYQKAPASRQTVEVADVGMEWLPRGARPLPREDVAAYLAAPPTVHVPWDAMRAARWDPRFWDPRYAAPLDGLCAPTVSLGDLIDYMTYGPIVVKRTPADCPGDVPVISQGQIEESGVNLVGAARVAAASVFDPPRCRVRRGDLLFPRSGAGSLGRNRLAVYDDDRPAALGCFVDTIRLRGVNPFFLWAFLKTRFGWGQIRRLINGVGMPNISFDEIRSLRVARVDAAFEGEVEARWRTEVRPAHEALEAACRLGHGVREARRLAETRMAALIRAVEMRLTEGLAEPGAYHEQDEH